MFSNCCSPKSIGTSQLSGFPVCSSTNRGMLRTTAKSPERPQNASTNVEIAWGGGKIVVAVRPKQILAFYLFQPKAKGGTLPLMFSVQTAQGVAVRLEARCIAVNHLNRGVRGAVIHHKHLNRRVVLCQHRVEKSGNQVRPVITGRDYADQTFCIIVHLFKIMKSKSLLFVQKLYHLCRTSCYDSIVREAMCDHCITANNHVVSKRNSGKYACSFTNPHITSNLHRLT